MIVKRKLKVLHIVPNFGTGGAEKLVVDLLLNYNKNEFDVAALSLYPKANTMYEQKMDENNIKVYYLDKHKGFDLSMIKKINKFIKIFNPDVVHTHLYVMPYVLFPVIINKIPVRIHTVHTIAEKELNKVGKEIQRIAYKYFNFIPVAITDEIMDSIKKCYKIKKIPIIYNGINVEEYRKKEEKRNEAIKLIHVGRFSSEKNHNLLIDTFKIVNDKFPNVKLLLVGDGKLKAEIVGKVNRMNLQDKVYFMGVRKDIPELLSKCDIFVLSSDYEGLPLTLLEAMAAGLPIVSTDVGGVSNIITNNINGILVKPNDPVLFSEAIIKLIKNKELRDKIGKNNEISAFKYDIRNTQKEYEKLYLSLLKKLR